MSFVDAYINTAFTVPNIDSHMYIHHGSELAVYAVNNVDHAGNRGHNTGGVFEDTR